ncbi:MAG: 8-oxo-dGTP diphosphatase [Pseudobutyrivibrio sp.]|nr:8-oxo-dGTP diphosphatase [Pseudobutyrivibrio sp.]
MELTTLCYLEKDGKYLMLHRNKKENDLNQGKYIGIGGHLEFGETPEDCIRREVLEETGLTLDSVKLCGLLTFVIDDYMEYSFLFTSDSFSGNLCGDCSEGNLVWIPKEEVFDLPLWEGDSIFLEKLAEEAEYFSLKLVYKNDVLVQAEFM